MPANDVLMNLGDAIAGVDRTGNYLKGNKLAADIDQTEAQTDAAMELAKQRRIQAERDEMERAAIERIQRMAPGALTDPATMPIGDMLAGKAGSDFSGAMQGRNYGQQFNERAIAATPEGETLGDAIVTDELRQSNLDALAPAAAVGIRRPGGGAPQIVADPDDPSQSILIPPRGGDPVTVNTPQGPQTARPRPRPATPPGPSSQQKNFEFLVSLGVPRERALRLAERTDINAQTTFQSARDAALRNFASPEEADAAGRAAVESIPDLTDPLLPVEPGQEPQEDYAEGDEFMDPATGQYIVLRGGIWVDADTGQPVQ